MKTGLKLAALLLTLILAPRMATADAVLLHRVGPVAGAAESVIGDELSSECDDPEGRPGGIPKRRWGVPRRWKLTSRIAACPQRETIRATPVTSSVSLDGTQGGDAGGAEARGQP